MQRLTVINRKCLERRLESSHACYEMTLPQLEQYQMQYPQVGESTLVNLVDIVRLVEEVFSQVHQVEEVMERNERNWQFSRVNTSRRSPSPSAPPPQDPDRFPGGPSNGPGQSPQWYSVPEPPVQTTSSERNPQIFNAANSLRLPLPTDSTVSIHTISSISSHHSPNSAAPSDVQTPPDSPYHIDRSRQRYYGRPGNIRQWDLAAYTSEVAPEDPAADQQPNNFDKQVIEPGTPDHPHADERALIVPEAPSPDPAISAPSGPPSEHGSDYRAIPGEGTALFRNENGPRGPRVRRRRSRD